MGIQGNAEEPPGPCQMAPSKMREGIKWPFIQLGSEEVKKDGKGTKLLQLSKNDANPLRMPITRQSQLEEYLTLTKEESNWCQERCSLPLLISDYFFSLINPSDPHDPIRCQVVPREGELEAGCESIDPLEEVDHSITSRLVHRYHNRAALLVTDRCFTYCRHCFRRRFTGSASGPISDAELEEAIAYLEAHAEIKEVLLTGGDLFTLSDERIDQLLSRLKESRADIIYRLCTRAVATYPERFTPALMAIIRSHQKDAPFYLLTQFNHPRELTPASCHAVDLFVDSGIPAMNQSVLLKDVNDSVDTLEELCNSLLYHRIKPYYLFQGDKVAGTRHLRVPLSRGLEIEAELRIRLSGLAMPQYTADLPEGGGKVILTHQYLVGRKENQWVFKTPTGSLRSYPE